MDFSEIKIKRNDNRKCEEDKLLTKEVIKEIALYHEIDILYVDLHVWKKCYEIDAIIHGRTKIKKLTRKIGIELKKDDFLKVVQQAVTKREKFYFDYFYIVMSNYPLFCWLVENYNILEKYGIGFIVSKPNLNFAEIVKPSKMYKIGKYKW